MIRHIFLDMDGVLVDFVTSALRLHERQDAIHSWPSGEWDLPTVLGISASQFWKRIDQIGGPFWAGLSPYPWMPELIDLVNRFAPFSVLSSPSLHAECPSGKVLWLREHLGGGFRDYLIGHQKYLCARPGSVLIDDNDDNVAEFREHCGQAILFPQRWNANHHVADRLTYVACELEKLVSCVRSH